MKEEPVNAEKKNAKRKLPLGRLSCDASITALCGIPKIINWKLIIP